MADLHLRLLAATSPLKPGTVLSRTNVNAPRAALLAVVELHAPGQGLGSGDLICDGPCREPWGDSSSWPCSTIQAIADQLGLTDQGERS